MLVQTYVFITIAVVSIITEAIIIFGMNTEIKKQKELIKQLRKNARVLKMNLDQKPLTDLWEAAGVDVSSTKIIPYHDEEVM